MCAFFHFVQRTHTDKKYVTWVELTYTYTFIIIIFDKRNSNFFPLFTRTLFNLSICVLLIVHIHGYSHESNDCVTGLLHVKCYHETW
jgi:hypothetical protein